MARLILGMLVAVLTAQYFPRIGPWGPEASALKNIPIQERLYLRPQADFLNEVNHSGHANSFVGRTSANVCTRCSCRGA